MSHQHKFSKSTRQRDKILRNSYGQINLYFDVSNIENLASPFRPVKLILSLGRVAMWSECKILLNETSSVEMPYFSTYVLQCQISWHILLQLVPAVLSPVCNHPVLTWHQWLWTIRILSTFCRVGPNPDNNGNLSLLYQKRSRNLPLFRTEPTLTAHLKTSDRLINVKFFILREDWRSRCSASLFSATADTLKAANSTYSYAVLENYFLYL